MNERVWPRRETTCMSCHETAMELVVENYLLRTGATIPHPYDMNPSSRPTVAKTSRMVSRCTFSCEAM